VKVSTARFPRIFDIYSFRTSLCFFRARLWLHSAGFFLQRWSVWVEKHLLSFIGKMVGYWLLISCAIMAVIFVVCVLRNVLVSAKARMAEADGALPLPLHNRRRRRESHYRLTLTRRNLSLSDGIVLDRLNREIEGLILIHDLERCIETPPGPEAEAHGAVEMLLQRRAELLNKYPPLPSFVYLVTRRWMHWKAAGRVRS